MRTIIESVRLRRMARALVIGSATGLAAAGCSSEVTRFSQPLFGGSTETPYTGSVTPSPVGGVERQQLADPGGQGFGTSQTGQPAQMGANVVVAQSGDTAYTIARRYGVPHDALMQANNMRDPNAVRAGQQIIIPTYSQATASWQGQQPSAVDNRQAAVAPVAMPQSQPQPQPQQQTQAPTASPQQGSSHRVGHGETVYSIARAYNVGPAAIIRANALQSPDQLRVGQTLTIPGATGATQQTAQQSQPQAQPAVEQRPAVQTAEARDETTPQPVPASLTQGQDSTGEPDTRAGIADPAPMSANTFRWPVRGRVVSAFGDTSNGTRNDGVKIAVPEGTSVRAAENGVVAYAGDELKGYGNLVLIRHSDDWVTAYAHNSEIAVRRGDQVTRGQVIARAGQSGSVNSPQLHFELRKGSQPVDPLRYMAEN